MAESSEVPITTQRNKFADVLRGIKERFKRNNLGIPQEHEEEPPAPRLTYPLLVESNENLRPAHRLLFHTTPTARFESIKQHGLITNPDDPSIGQSLGYSVYFGYEHGVMRNETNKQLAVRDTTPNNYVLTVWETGRHVHQSRVDLAKRSRFVTPAKLVDQAEAPDMFYDASPSGAHFLLTREKVGKLPPQHLIGAFLLDRETRDEFQKALIYARYGMKTADGIEQDLYANLPKSSQMQLRQDIYARQFTHDLVVSIEHDLLRFIVSPLVKKAQERTNIWQRGDYYTGGPIDALWHIIFYRSQVNDPVSARYLDTCYNSLIKILLAREVNVDVLQQRLLSSVKEYKEGKVDQIAKKMLQGNTDSYFGFISGFNAAVELMRQMGINKS
ncbi:hypothetical protein HYW43_01810 [Candidatus Daviesbacteria bacterium]|nr:hypothetical protein [Candidatus Daviesbacteria bacterium]